MRELKKESWLYIFLIFLVLVATLYSLFHAVSSYDPRQEGRYDNAAREIEHLKGVIISFYCERGHFPETWNDLVPDVLPTVPRDPWGNPYKLTSLAWRVPGTGLDLVSMGPDGKSGGKGWRKCDIIARIDKESIDCPE